MKWPFLRLRKQNSRNAATTFVNEENYPDSGLDAHLAVMHYRPDDR